MIRVYIWFIRIIRRFLKKIQKTFGKELLVLGDSHVAVFKSMMIRRAFPFYYIHVASVGGATVSGLENPNSKTQAFEKFLNSVQKSKAKKIIVNLGEIDTGFVIWYRAEKHQTDVLAMFDDAVNKYQKFLLFLSEEHRVICLSTPLPTIPEGQEWGEVANARKEVKASQLARTKLTLMFNKAIKEFCQENRIEYIDLDSKSLGADGLVDNYLLSKNPLDHHYDPIIYSKMIIKGLKGKI